MTSSGPALPPRLAELVEEFGELEGADKLTLLLELSDELPPLPDGMEAADMEQVPECQTPLYVTVDASGLREGLAFALRSTGPAGTCTCTAGAVHRGADRPAGDRAGRRVGRRAGRPG